MIILGLTLIVAVVSLGFICVDEATWLAWRAVWLLGGGVTLGVGIGLVLMPILQDRTGTEQNRAKVPPAKA